MATETTANGTPTAAADRFRPSRELVAALLKWSADDKEELAQLLVDSVREGFTTLEEAEEWGKNLLRRRIEDVVSGKAVLLDIDDVLADLEREFGKEDEG